MDKCKFYIAPNRRGRLIKIVEDVKVPISDKFEKLGVRGNSFLIKQRLVARFVNEEECAFWYEAYKNYIKKFEEANGSI